jgi:putative addiction module component (TIGR02574 family)
VASQYAEISRSALSLPQPKRAQLAKRLIDSLERVSQKEVDEAWSVEIARRVRDYEAGRTKAIPWKRAMREARARLRR